MTSNKPKPQEYFFELIDPGDPEPAPGTPGSIEQQLDMCEEGTLRGDDILHRHGEELSRNPGHSGDPTPFDFRIYENYRVDMSEDDREGDEMSGDEHSSGLEGGESELEGQLHIATGLPGDSTDHEREVLIARKFRPEGKRRRII